MAAVSDLGNVTKIALPPNVTLAPRKSLTSTRFACQAKLFPARCGTITTEVATGLDGERQDDYQSDNILFQKPLMSITPAANRVSIAILSAVLLFLPGFRATATQVTMQVNSASSTLRVDLCASPPGAWEECDNDTANVQGYVVVSLDDNGAPTAIALRNYDLQATRDMNLSLVWSILFELARINATATGLGLSHPSPGPQNSFYPVSGGAFTAVNVPYQARGAANYHASGLACTALQNSGQSCDGSFDLSQNGPSTVPSASGTVQVNNGVATVHLDITISQPLDASNPSLGTMTVHAIINASAAVPPGLVPFGSDWRYRDDGSDQGTGWRATSFDDSGWSIGPAQLGYGEGDEATLNSYGSDPANKYITTYYRHAFNVPNPAIYNNLVLRLLRDDGAVVYLNGTEVFRTAMPAGTVNSTTLASYEVNGLEEGLYFAKYLSPSSLVTGQNVLAVEVHQNSASSSDLSFDLELQGNFSFNNQSPTVAITSPANGASVTGNGIVLQATASDPDGVITLVEFFQGGVKIGEVSPAPPYASGSSSLTLATLCPGSYTFTARVSDNSAQSSDSAPVIVNVIPDSTVVVITSPTNGAEFPAGADVLIQASVTDADGRVDRVEFYAGTNKLGESLTAPYQWLWSHPASGAYTLTARAYDDCGTVSTSAPVRIAIGTFPLVTFGSNWRYLDDGSDQGTAWQAPSFNDSGWPIGPAQLGYGDGDEATVNSYGTNSANKHITYYYRHAFNVPNPALYTNLVLRLLRDDGAVVYLNGTEVFRTAMPTGAVSSATLATYAVSGLEENLYFAKYLNPASVVAGSNVLAVEVHQNTAGSSDLSFDLELQANFTFSNQVPTVAIISPTNGTVIAGSNFVLQAASSDPDGVITLVEFFEGAVKIGEVDLAPPYISGTSSVSVAVANLCPGTYTFTARVWDNSAQSADSAPVTVNVMRANSVLVAQGSEWKYLDNGTDQGTAWRSLAFNDTAWLSGRAEFGYGDGGEVTTNSYGSDPNNRYITYYYRHKFVVNNLGSMLGLVLHLLRDDGAVVYLNDSEVFRNNMPTGAVTYATLANGTVGGVDETNFISTVLSANSLVSGTNVLAVEIHQVTTNSSDISFDLALVAGYPNQGPTVMITNPVEGAEFPAGADVLIQASAADVDGSVVRVEFYAGTNKLGESLAPPFAWLWSQPASGQHTLTARAYDDCGTVSISAPVRISVGTFPLVTFGSNWRYLDNGSNLGTAWRVPSFDDSSWQRGPAQLGYGEGDEVTTNQFGPDANNKYITTYYRHAFSVPNPALYTNLVLRLLRDDGAVVYLNGTEVFRTAMPTGGVSSATLASYSVGGLEENLYFAKYLNPASVVTGSNVLAVEVHQNSAGSSDLSFDLELQANFSFSNQLPTVAIISPTNGTLVAGSFVLQASASDPDGVVTLVEFFQGAAKIGEVNLAPPYASGTSSISVAVANFCPGTYTFSARVWDNSAQSADSSPVTVNVMRANSVLVAQGSEWKYLDNGTDQGTTWRSLAFNDTTWLSGRAELGYGDGGEVTTNSYGPDPNNRYITYYYRHKVVVSNAGAALGLVLHLLRDDGAVVYLNDNEVFRNNMPTGAVTYTTLASVSVSGADETNFLSTVLPASSLVSGTNVLAVEIHQASTNSSDISFDLALVAGLPNQGPTVVIANPVEGAEFPAGVDVLVQASAADVDGAVGRVEFYAGTNKVGESFAPPYQCLWSQPVSGRHTLTARAYDECGAVGTSAPVRIFVGTFSMVKPGAVWNYLDNGANLGAAWHALGYNDTSWKAGPAQLGYGDGDEATVVGYGPNSTNKYITTYFRRAFVVLDKSLISNLTLRLLRDDGAVVYLNGTEVFRSNMSNGVVTYLTLASNSISGAEETTYYETAISPSLLLNGINALAVEVHQASAGSDDLSFDLELLASVRSVSPRISLERGQSAATLHWPSTAAAYRLYQTHDLKPPVFWFLSPATVQDDGTWKTAILPSNGTNTYFLLGQ